MGDYMERNVGPVAKKRVPSKRDLFMMVLEGNLEEFKENRKYADLRNDRDSEGFSYLHRAVGACKSDDAWYQCWDLISFLLSECPRLAQFKNFEGQTALNLACKKARYTDLLTLLINAAPQTIDTTDNKGMTPLHIVARNIKTSYWTTDDEDDGDDLFEAMKILIEKGADVNSENDKGRNILQTTLRKYTAFNEKLFGKIITLLLENGANVRSSDGNHAFQYTSNEFIIKLILDHDPSQINAVYDEGERKQCTLLHHCLIARDHHEKIVTLLIEHGALVENPTNTINLAREHGYKFTIIKQLLEKYPEYDANLKTLKKDETLLIQYGATIEIVNFLLNFGTDPKIATKDHKTALNTAIKGKDVEAVQKLLALGTDPFDFNNIEFCTIVQICHLFTLRSVPFDRWFKIFKSLIGKSVLKKIPNELHVRFYSRLIDELCHERVWCDTRNKLNQIMPVIIKSHPNFNSLQIPPRQREELSWHYKLSAHTLSPYGYALKRFTGYKPNVNRINPFINILLKCGFSIEAPEGCTTPLTVLVSIFSPHSITEDDTVFGANLASQFIELGAAINTNTLQLYVSVDNVELNRINSMKDKYDLPDPLFLAYISNKYTELTKTLLPYWWAPPVLLIIFKNKHDVTPGCLVPWMKLLFQYGGVPHGTDMFKDVNKYLRYMKNQAQRDGNDSSNRAFLQAWKAYKAQYVTRGPLSLQMLSKYSLRKYLYEKAAKEGTNLLKLLQSSVPYLLRSVAIH